MSALSTVLDVVRESNSLLISTTDGNLWEIHRSTTPGTWNAVHRMERKLEYFHGVKVRWHSEQNILDIGGWQGPLAEIEVLA